MIQPTKSSDELPPYPPTRERPLLSDLDAYAAFKAEMRKRIQAVHAEIAKWQKKRDAALGRIDRSTSNVARKMPLGAIEAGNDSVHRARKSRVAAKEAESKIAALLEKKESLLRYSYGAALGRDVQDFDYTRYLSAGLALPLDRKANYADHPASDADVKESQ